MNDYRALTAEECSALSPVAQRLGITAPGDIARFIDSRLNKVYDVYLINRKNGKIVLKKCDQSCRDKTKYDMYFAGLDFAVPHILDCISIGEETYITMEYAEGGDARGCGQEAAGRIGTELARIQGHYLTSGGHTQASDDYFTKYVADHCRKVKDYFDDFDGVFQTVERRFFEAPHSLVHDDLLPINVIMGKQKPWIIDWATTGIYPYFLDLARFAFVYSPKDGFYISNGSAMAFLDAYYDEMRKNLKFSMDRKRFYQDVAISAFCQYTMFLYYEKDIEHIQSTTDYKYLREIIAYLKKIAHT